MKSFHFSLSLILSSAAVLGSSAGALELTEIQGKVEIKLGDGWTTAKAGLFEGVGPLRTRAGQVTLEEGGGRFKLGSQSTLELRQGEPALLSGQGYLEGPLAGFVGGVHFRLERGSRARLDLTGPLSRLAVLEGKINLYSVRLKNLNVGAGQSLNLLSAVQSAYTEEPKPWYLEKISGLGAVRLEAFKGSVEQQNAEPANAPWQPMQVSDSLEGEGVVRTGAASWAELGFEGGGYLRLGAQARLRVLGLEKLVSGQRKVILMLEQGSTWNVVEKGKGNYELRTATLVAGVRGTTFRVDSSGLLKVLEGQVVASTAAGEQPVPSGQQVQNGQKGTLVLDAIDRFNLERDRLRNAALKLEGELPTGEVRRDLKLEFTVNPDAEVSLKVGSESVKLTPDAAGVVRYQPTLAEGEVALELTVKHYAQNKALSSRYLIDRSAPRLTLESVRREGEQGVLKVKVQDASPVTLTLTRATNSEAIRVEGTLESGELRFPWFIGSLELRLQDAAGNATVQTLELDSGF